MNIRPIWKLSIILAVLAFACYQLYPNLVWYTLPLAERQAQAKRKNPLVEKVIPLGLDFFRELREEFPRWSCPRNGDGAAERRSHAPAFAVSPAPRF